MSASPVPFPNLFVLGAAKAGTTSIHHALARHPGVFMSRVKEPKYFAFRDETRTFTGPRDPGNDREFVVRERYLELFRDRGGARFAGESSTIYLYSPVAAANIRDAVPDATLIAVLREPLERAYSNYLHARQRGLEPEGSFQRAMELEEERIAAGWGPLWHYKRKGLYADQIERYLARFPRERIFVGRFDDLRADPAGFFRRIFEFLGLSPETPPDAAIARNESRTVRSPLLHRLLRSPRLLPRTMRSRLGSLPLAGRACALLERLQAANLEAARPLPADARRAFQDYFAADIERLEAMLAWDLGGWRGDSRPWPHAGPTS
jgi:hypothetical protein